ncbi:MAG: hypothetical protein WCC48_06160 [Anaeromyxobacteraceae bacterium]
MPAQPSTSVTIDVTAEAKQSLLEHLSRAGPAQLVRVYVGHG